MNARSTWFVQDFIWELEAMTQYFGVKVVERSEREQFGIPRDCYEFNQSNVWRERRERHRKNTHGFAPGPNRTYNSEGKVILTPELHNFAMGMATMRFVAETGELPRGRD